MAIIRLVSGVAAGLCVLVLPLWALGVPGIDGNNYARGWKMGLNAIMIYPAVWVGVWIVSSVLKRFQPQNASLDNASSAFFALILAAAIARVVQAFVVMSAK